MKHDEYIERIQSKLSKLKGFARIEFLASEKNKLDETIFNKDSIYGGDYRDKLLLALGTNNPTGHAEDLNPFFRNYKDDWGVAKQKYFYSNESSTYEDFLAEFRDLIPQDIADSIKLCESVDIEDLEIQDSLNVFNQYYKVREWIKNQLTQEYEKHTLSDREALLLANSEKVKFEWNGSAIELVGLNEILIHKNWITPGGSSRDKAICLLKCFSIKDKSSSIGYITNLFKEYGGKTTAFQSIKENK